MVGITGRRMGHLITIVEGTVYSLWFRAVCANVCSAYVSALEVDEKTTRT